MMWRLDRRLVQRRVQVEGKGSMPVLLSHWAKAETRTRFASQWTDKLLSGLKSQVTQVFLETLNFLKLSNP